METMQVCPECGAAWHDDKTCQDYFHQMLFWEHEYPDNWQVHHLTVLCYYLQHPGLYSPEGLSAAENLLADFLERGVTPEEVRRRSRVMVDSWVRTWKIKGTSTSRGAYDPPIEWSMTAADVVANDTHNYCDSVRTWARSIYEVLKSSGNLM